MRAVFYFCFLILSLYSMSFMRVSPAYAGSICGYVADKEIRHVYELANDIDIFLDIKEDLRRFCSRIGMIKSKDKYWFRNRANKKFMKERREAIEDILADVRVLAIPLTTIKDWIRIDPRGDKDKKRRMISIKKGRREALLYMEYLYEDIVFLEELIKAGPK